MRHISKERTAKKFVFVTVLVSSVLFNIVIPRSEAATVTHRVYSHGSDASIVAGPYPGSWNLQYNATIGRDPGVSNFRSSAYTGEFNSNQGYVALYRSFLAFDTSVIPDNAEIVSVNLRIVPDVVLDGYNDQYSYMSVLEGRQASPTGLTLDDIEMCGDVLENPTKGATDIDVSNIVVEQPLVFSFNETGKSWINKTGYTKLCIREGHDVENKETVNNGNFWRESGITYYTSESAGTSTDPYLEIIYQVPIVAEKDIHDLLDELVGAVRTAGFQKSTEQSYLAHLEKLGGMLDTANTNAIKNQLEAFIKKLGDDVRKGVVIQADALILTKKAEAILHRLSEAIDPVPLVTQVVSPYPSIAETSVWAPALYAGGRASTVGSCGLTIAQCGCAVSSLSMLGKYYGINTGYNGTNVSPLNMNDWLLANGGYTDKGSILWNYALAYMGEKKNGKALTKLSLDTQNATKTETIRAFVNKSTPALGFSTAHGHWMVLTGTTDAGFTIRDPFWYNTTTTDDVHDAAGKIQGYANLIDKANLIGYSTALHNIDKSVEIVLESPAELLITDSKGRRLGYDPVANIFVNEIPGGSYDHEDFISDPANPSADPHKTKRLMLVKPEGEVFDLKVIGTGSGEYNLTTAVTDGKGGLFGSRASSTTSLGHVDGFTLTTSMDTNDLPLYLKEILGQIPLNYQKKFVQAFKVIVGQSEKDHVVSTTHIIEGLIKYTKQQFGSTPWANGVVLALTALLP